MKHFGDITKIDGHNVPIVDIVTGGSPCQDLSVAGKRAGLEGERSGLFMEQIRIVKEMRDEYTKQLQMRGADVNIRFIKPRFMVWENVPGAFSSNKGDDFRCVLEEICRVADKTATIPIPKGGKWSTSGCIMGDWWSVAWRLHDAQFWGVPQRRKRIALVADFGGRTAPEILFERESLSGNIEQSKQERKETTRYTRESTYQSAYTLKIRGGAEIDSYGKKAGKGALVQTEKSGTLGVSQDQTLITIENKTQPQAVVYGLCSDGSNSMRSSNPYSGIYEADSSRTLDNNGGNPTCNQGGMIVVDREPMCIQRRFSSVNVFENGISPTLEAGAGEGGNNMPMVTQEQSASGLVTKGDGRAFFTGDKHTSLSTGGGQAGQGYPCVITHRLHNIAEPTTASKASFFMSARSDGKSDTLVATDYKDPPIVTYENKSSNNKTIVLEGNGQRESHKGDGYKESDVMYTLNTIEQHAVCTCKKPEIHSESEHIPCIAIDRASFNQGKNAQYDFSIQEEIAQPLLAKGPGGY
ncbi:MAG: DNA cytosine methyltransferase [Bacteroidales bacterium]|nr:DNA cytosine methyltransferase [Bacteroidales bacterium]